MDLDLNCVETFIVLARDLHFGQAAQELHLTPSAVSKRIQKLEQELGIRLVNRGPAGFISLTAAGTRFHPHALSLLDIAEAARSAARHAEARTHFRLGMPGHLHDHPERIYLPALAQALRREVPGSTLHCYGVPFPAVVSSLLDGLIDVMWDVSDGNHPEIETMPLRSFDRIGVVQLNHPFADAEEVPVQEFAEQPMIFGVGVPSAWMGRFYLDDIRDVSDANLIAMQGKNSTDVKVALSRTMGVTVAPAFMANDLGPGLTRVKLRGVPPTPSFASRRRNDDRESVLRLIHGLQGLNTAV